MDQCSFVSLDNGKWTMDDNKVIKVIGALKNRVAFQWTGKYTRGISISKEAFMKMEHVTITPGMELNLEDNVYLKNIGNMV